MAGYGELVLLSPVGGLHYDPDFIIEDFLFVRTWMLMVYGLFVATLSPVAFNFATLRIGEDLFLLVYAGFSSYLAVADTTRASNGQFLLLD